MYKLLAIDLDGTLLNSYGTISNKNKQAIKKAKEKGIEVVIASGRHITSVKSFAKEINAEDYSICGNGAILYDMKNDKILYNKFIEKDKILEIIQMCEQNSIYYNVYTETEILTRKIRRLSRRCTGRRGAGFPRCQSSRQCAAAGGRSTARHCRCCRP